MAAGTYERKEFVGGAAAVELASPLTDSATSCTVSSVVGWPDADPDPFVAVIDRGTPTEEKILVRARTGTTFTTIDRGYDDTVGLAHSTGAAVEHGLDAATVDQANRLANLLEAKGQIIASNGVNPVAVAAAAMDGSEDGQVVKVNSGTATGLEFDFADIIEFGASAPDLGGSFKLWLDDTTGVIRASNGATWIVPAQVPFFASEAARTTALGGDPTPGTASLVGTGGSLEFEVYDGTTWIAISRRDEAIPKFADATARDAFYTAPANGDHAYLTGSSVLQEYRGAEWITLNQKVTVADAQPSGPLTGDIWLQPIS